MLILALVLIVSALACLSIGAFRVMQALRMADGSFLKFDRAVLALIWCLVASMLAQIAALVAKFR